nr:hypothetical protein [Calliblepharis sp.]
MYYKKQRLATLQETFAPSIINFFH